MGAKHLQQQIRELQRELDSTKNDKKNHDDLIVLTQSLTDMEKRVEDIHQNVAYWRGALGISVALFGSLVTGVIVFFSLRTSREAIAEAKQAAETEVSSWLAEKGDKAIKPLEDSLKRQGAEILADISKRGDETLKKIVVNADNHDQRMEMLFSRLEASLSSQGPSEKNPGPKDVLELQRKTKMLREKPENQYTFNDWRCLYLDAVNRNSLDEIRKYIERMAHAAADDRQNALAKSSLAWLMFQLSQYDEAIKLCDEIVEEYGEVDDLRLIEYGAEALVNKGWALGQQGQRAAAIAVYDDVLSRFGARSEVGIVEYVARALINKGVELSKEEGQLEAAIATYNEVALRYGARGEASIVEYVGRALENKGTILSLHDQPEAGIAAYDDIVSRYGARSEAEIVKLVAGVLNKKSIVLGQRGQQGSAITVYDEVLSRYSARSETGITMEVGRGANQ